MEHSQFYFGVILGILVKKGVLSEEELDSMNAYVRDNPFKGLDEVTMVEILGLIDSWTVRPKED